MTNACACLDRGNRAFFQTNGKHSGQHDIHFYDIDIPVQKTSTSGRGEGEVPCSRSLHTTARMLPTGQALAIATCFIYYWTVTYTWAAIPSLEFEGGRGELQSPVASSAEDPLLGFNAVFAPVPSCLASVILVIYVQSLEMLEHMDMYQDMYGPYVGGIEFYVDGTWCDPRKTSVGGRPCYGEQLDRSTIPARVNVVDGNGGGWMMQRSFIHAAMVPREVGGHDGYLFMTDDVLLNIGQLSRAVNESGCDVIWRSATERCENVLHGDKTTSVMKRFQMEAREFYKTSDQQFRTQLAQNMGSPSTYCMGTQNDFLYMPKSMSADWARVAQQMTDAGLVFTFAFYTAIFGIAPMQDMVVLRSKYLPDRSRSTKIRADAEFEGKHEPYCWKGSADVSTLLAMHIIHPNKLSSSTAWSFALTLNPPGAHVALPSRGSNITVNDHGEGTRGPSAFWCGT